jgi:peptide/nickel transport system substrate-binding protein
MDRFQNKAGGSFKGKVFTYILYFVFICLFLFVSGELFLKKQSVDYKGSEVSSLKNLRVVYPDLTYSLEPTLADPLVRQRLVNIYEPLVKHTRYLDDEPCLALSWGLLDDLTWQFQLRPNVYFHDGSSFGASDVSASINRAKSSSISEISDIVSNISSVDVIDDLNILIKTVEPDPLLLDKLSFVLIIPSEYEETDLSWEPVGTGPYKFASSEESLNKIVLNRFDDYWRSGVKFEEVSLLSFVDKAERVMALVNGDADLIVFVPTDAAESLKKAGFPILSVPTLEVQFLLFNLSSELMRSSDLRQVISYSIDQESLIDELGSFYVKSLNQFVSNGVFGFNPNIADHIFNPKLASELVVSNNLSGVTLQVHLPLGFEVLGEHIRKSLSAVGLSPVISYMELDRLLLSMERGDADIYFMAFKSALGDSIEFLNSMVRSDGDFNVFSYVNENVDYLIKGALVDFDNKKRLSNLQEVMRIIIEDDYIGVPLFEYESLFSFSEEIDLKPRIDGLIYFDDLILK